MSPLSKNIYRSLSQPDHLQNQNVVIEYQIGAVCLLQEVFMNIICLYLLSDCSPAAAGFT